MTPGESLPDDIENTARWALNCDVTEAEHVHTADCYRRVSCGTEVHLHDGNCYNADELICEKEEHTHEGLCFLSPEEREALDHVSHLISEIPSETEITEKAEECLEDEDAYAAYMILLMQQVEEAYKAYLALGEEQRQYVENGEYLLNLVDILGTRTLEETSNADIWGVLAEDGAYIEKIEVKNITDGTAPFDRGKHTDACYNSDKKVICTDPSHREEDDGDDTRPDNLRVRTYDSVTYKFAVKMKSYSDTTGYKNARVKLEFVLPLTSDKAEFDLAAMAWMDMEDQYKPVVTNEKRIIIVNGAEEEVDCQVLTCYKHLIPAGNGLSVVPGDFEENVTVKVKAMRNGDKFAPVFSAAMEYNHWGETNGAWSDETQSWGAVQECPKENHGVERKSVRANEITVSAAPKYNIQLRGDSSYIGTFDFNTGDDGRAQNKEAGEVVGRAIKLVATLQLYNDNRSKGLKGIELPDASEPITFKLKVSSAYGNNGEHNTSREYMPLLWSYGRNSVGNYGDPIDGGDGRPILETNRGAGLGPYGNGFENACDNSGTWTAVQQGDEITVTVSGYTVNTDNMPLRNGDRGDVIYGADMGIGCFSAGQLWIVQPYNKIGENSAYQGPDYDVVTQHGEGAFSTTVTATDLKMKTVSESWVQDSAGKNDHQMKTDDDRFAGTLDLTLPGGLQNRVRYADLNNYEQGVGVNDNRDGRDFATVGSELRIMGGFTYHTNRIERNQLYWGTTLTKFYGEALTPIEEGEDYLIGNEIGAVKRAGMTVKAYYATKQDGSDWKSDKELQKTYEDELIFYERMSDIPEGHKCVGILYCYQGPGLSPDQEDNDYPDYSAFHRAKVTDNMDFAGKTYMLASTTRVWTKAMFESDDRWKNKVADWKNANVLEGIETGKGFTIDLDRFPAGYLTSANIGDGYPDDADKPTGHHWYIKETYAEDGSGILGTHNSDWSHWGDTLLIIGYKTEITKHLLQKTGTNEKDTFNLDANQRVVDFKLQPGVRYDNVEGSGNNNEIKTDVTIVDILPDHLTYVKGSAYYGYDGSKFTVAPENGNEGTVMNYIQTTPRGGTQGKIEGGRQMEPVLGEIQEKQADGSTKTYHTLTWTLENITVGKDVPAIFYSAVIGTKENAKTDVPEGTSNLENRVYITSQYDRRDPTIENHKLAKAGITVTRGSASSYGKYTYQSAVEEDGEIDYVVYYNNNSENHTWVSMMDTMPALNVTTGNNSIFTGSYILTGWTLDINACEKEKVVIYYTEDETYKDKILKDLIPDNAGADNFWKQITLNAEGTISTPDTVPEGWKKAEIRDDGTIVFAGEGINPAAAAPVAWVVFGQLEGGQSININQRIRLVPEKTNENTGAESALYRNLVSSDDKLVVETPVVRRTLEGLTWMDYNRNGIQDTGELQDGRLSGIRVELLKLRDGGDPAQETDYEPVYYPVKRLREGGNPGNLRDYELFYPTDESQLQEGETLKQVQIFTGQQTSLKRTEGDSVSYENGRYKFTDLPPGIYGVRFTDGEYQISGLHATVQDCWNNSSDTVDSDGYPTVGQDNALEKTVILGVEMKNAETMYAEQMLLQEEKYHDSGFYGESELTIQKVDEDGNKLTGVEFTISDARENLVSFTSKDGVYEAIPTEDGGALSGTYYYIVSALNTGFVIGIENDSARLQEKRESDDQLFRVYPRDDGTFSFWHKGTEKWLDLGSWKIEDGSSIQVWKAENTGNEPTDQANHKWYVTQDANGYCEIQSKHARDQGTNKAFLDVNSAEVREGNIIQAWTQNGTAAQKWRLVRAISSEETTTTLTVNESGELRVGGLLPGEYTISEICAPTGYALLKEPVKIKVAIDGKISLADQDGVIEVLQVVNKKADKLYELPSTGGIGTYWYTISGTLLMMAAALILYKKKYAGRCGEANG
ncbi:MAG: LPXTG cell wall anchor domain-containing protein [Lachnospiraceae bacterium]|nr:LPXTG cell wall anchor domain-containing protein [Lachnospiraceae bacterium]